MLNPQRAVALALKLVLSFASVVLMVWYAMALPFALYGVNGLPALLIALYPFVYWAFCVFTCFRILRGRVLVTSGIVANLGLVPLIAWSFLNRGEALIGILFITFIFFWALMCAARLDEDEYRKKHNAAEHVVGSERG